MLVVVSTLMAHTPYIEVGTLTIVRGLHGPDAGHTGIAVARIGILALVEHHGGGQVVDILGIDGLSATGYQVFQFIVTLATFHAALPAHGTPFPLEHIVIELHALVYLTAPCGLAAPDVVEAVDGEYHHTSLTLHGEVDLVPVALAQHALGVLQNGRVVGIDGILGLGIIYVTVADDLTALDVDLEVGVLGKRLGIVCLTGVHDPLVGEIGTTVEDVEPLVQGRAVPVPDEGNLGTLGSGYLQGGSFGDVTFHKDVHQLQGIGVDTRRVVHVGHLGGYPLVLGSLATGIDLVVLDTETLG